MEYLFEMEPLIINQQGHDVFCKHSKVAHIQALNSPLFDGKNFKRFYDI